MLTDPKEIKVLIVSANPYVTDFLRVSVITHGYETEAVKHFHEALTRVRHGLAHMIFIDDDCVGMDNLENFQLRMQDLSHEGVPIILLTTEQIKQHLAQRNALSFFRILTKPVGYLQIGTVLADLLIHGKKSRINGVGLD